MNAENTVSELMAELDAIGVGRCFWCSTHRPHPDYSRCSHSERTGRDAARLNDAQSCAVELVAVAGACRLVA
jgi:hypothetical protein